MTADRGSSAGCPHDPWTVCDDCLPVTPSQTYRVWRAAEAIASAADDSAFVDDGDVGMWEARQEDRDYWLKLAVAAVDALTPDGGSS